MEITFARSEDGARCNDFYNNYYGLERTLEQWQWEFEAYNQSNPLPFVFTLEGDEVVATQALIKIPFIDEGGVFWTAKSEETLVSPKMRGKSVFDKMYDPIFDFAKKESLYSIWGFTPAVKPFERVGFSVPLSTKQLFKVFQPRAANKLPALQNKNALFKAGAWFLALVAALKSRVHDLLFSARPNKGEDVRPIGIDDFCGAELSKTFVERWGGTTIFRDNEFMKWRVFENPYQENRVLGYFDRGVLSAFLIYSLDSDESGYIVDILSAHPDGIASDERAVFVLLSEASRQLRLLGAHSLRAWSVTNHPFDNLVSRVSSKLGFIKLKVGSPAVFYEVPNHAARDSESYRNFESWYVTRLFTQGTQG